MNTRGLSLSQGGRLELSEGSSRETQAAFYTYLKKQDTLLEAVGVVLGVG